MTATERRRRDRYDDVKWLADTGENLTGAAARLDPPVAPDSLAKWCAMYAPDLGRTLAAREPIGVGR